MTSRGHHRGPSSIGRPRWHRPRSARCPRDRWERKQSTGPRGPRQRPGPAHRRRSFPWCGSRDRCSRTGELVEVGIMPCPLLGVTRLVASPSTGQAGMTSVDARVDVGDERSLPVVAGIPAFIGTHRDHPGLGHGTASTLNRLRIGLDWSHEFNRVIQVHHHDIVTLRQQANRLDRGIDLHQVGDPERTVPGDLSRGLQLFRSRPAVRTANARPCPGGVPCRPGDDGHAWPARP